MVPHMRRWTAALALPPRVLQHSEQVHERTGWRLTTARGASDYVNRFMKRFKRIWCSR